MTREQELKPCPFCGVSLERSEVFSSRTSVYYFHPKSDDERCPAQDVLVHGPSSAAKWNSRAALSHEGEAKVLGGNETLNLLNDVRKFIEAEYRDPAAEPDGEWIAKEARPIHDRVCRVLANLPSDAALSTPKVEAEEPYGYVYEERTPPRLTFSKTRTPINPEDGHEISETVVYASPTITDEAVERAAKHITKWLGFSWDGLLDGRVTHRGFPVFTNNQYGWRFHGRKGDMLDLARAAFPSSPTITSDDIERAARALDPEIWEMDAPTPTRAATEDFHARREWSIETARTVLTAAFPSRGEVE